jgi:hypothetical protein
MAATLHFCLILIPSPNSLVRSQQSPRIIKPYIRMNFLNKTIMPLTIQRYYWSIPGEAPSPLQASGGSDRTPWIPHFLILSIIPRKESVMSFQCCPQCMKRTLAPTGAFWCCTNCETAITSQALAAMRALSKSGKSQKGLLVHPTLSLAGS